MSHATSSAQPVKLYRYADVARNIDHELAAEAGSLGAALHRFESTCREPGFAVKASHLADALQAYARAAEPVDNWVQAVGRGFERADQRAWGIWALIATWLGWLKGHPPTSRSTDRQSLLDQLRHRQVLIKSQGPFSAQAATILAPLVAQKSLDSVPPHGLLPAFTEANSALGRAIASMRRIITVFRIRFWLRAVWERLGSLWPGRIHPSLPNSLAAIPLPPSTDLSGAILGVSDYAAVKFSEIATTLQDIAGQLQSLQDDLTRLAVELMPIQKELAEVERQKKELQDRLDDLRAERDDFWNKLKPSEEGWRWGFDDRFPDAPWRTESDDAEDRIDALEAQLAALSQREAKLRKEMDALIAEQEAAQQRYAQLGQAQTDLQERLQRGIQLDGPTQPSPMAWGCTYYAAQHRKVDWGPPLGHALEWNEKAKAAGYDVGATPAPGAIVVFEPNSRFGHDTYGHVAIVESIRWNEDKRTYTLVVNQGSWYEGQPVGPGKVTTKVELQITADELPYISYIYDKRV